MRFLFFCYVQQKPGKDLTEEVRGLFLRVAQKLEISVLGDSRRHSRHQRHPTSEPTKAALDRPSALDHQSAVNRRHKQLAINTAAVA